MTLRFFAISAAALLSLAACGANDPAPGAPGAGRSVVQVTDVWCRPTPNGARSGACYLTLKATGSADRLVGVSTPAAGMAMVHRTGTAGGVMTMTEATDGLALPVDQAVTLAPGGDHLMLTRLKGPLVDGTLVSLTLDFFRGPDITVSAPVRQPAA